MHMGWLQVLQLEQVPVVQQVLAVRFADFGYCGVYCFCRCFAAEQVLVQQYAYVLLLNATQKTHNPVLFA